MLSTVISFLRSGVLVLWRTSGLAQAKRELGKYPTTRFPWQSTEAVFLPKTRENLEAFISKVV